MEPLLIGLLCAGSGAFSIVCAGVDADWFMENRKARFFVSILGRNGARIFYIIFGLVLLGVGIGFATGLIPTQSKN
jgi:hypothetical protein